MGSGTTVTGFAACQCIPDPKTQMPLILSGICVPALVTGLPAIMGDGYIHRAFYRLSRPVCHFVGGCSCRVPAVLRAGRNLSSSRYITGTLYIAIAVPFESHPVFNDLSQARTPERFDSGKPHCFRFKKQYIFGSALATRTEVRTPPRHHDPLDCGSARPARLVRPLINVVLQLEKATGPLGIYIIRN